MAQPSTDDLLDGVLERMAEQFFSTMPVVSPHTGELLGALNNRDVLSRIVSTGEQALPG